MLFPTALTTVVFVHKAPAVSFVAEPNAVMTAGHSVTVTGLSFATLDATASVLVGVTSCATAAWGSATSVRCLMAAGEGSSKHLGVTVETVVGTRSVGFSYDGTLGSEKSQRFCVWTIICLCSFPTCACAVAPRAAVVPCTVH